jgi:hypothetical protein
MEVLLQEHAMVRDLKPQANIIVNRDYTVEVIN